MLAGLPGDNKQASRRTNDGGKPFFYSQSRVRKLAAFGRIYKRRLDMKKKYLKGMSWLQVTPAQHLGRGLFIFTSPDKIGDSD